MNMTPEPWLYPLTFGDTLATNEWIEWRIHAFLNSSFIARMIHAGRRDAIGDAVILWSASYLEDPAGTLPDDDVLLAHKAGYGANIAAWQEIRPFALYGWSPVFIESPETGEPIMGRLGHKVIASVAYKSAKRRDGRKAGREAGQLAVTKSRIRKHIIALGHSETLTKDDSLITGLARFLATANLYVTDENVAAALAAVAGISKVVRFSPRAGG